MKAYCLDCKWFENLGCRCVNRNNMVDTPYSIEWGCPAKINKNNDCRYFEPIPPKPKNWFQKLLGI